MAVRPGKGLDLKRVTELLRHAHSRSIYASWAKIDEKKVFELFNRAVWFHGQHVDGGMYYLVSEVNGVIEGFFVGVLSPVYVVGHELEAQDIYTYTTGNAGRLDAVNMMRAFWQWAESCERVIDITMSNSDFIEGNRDKLTKFLLSQGFEDSNSTYKRRIVR